MSLLRKAGLLPALISCILLLARPLAAQTFTLLHTYTASGSEGVSPYDSFIVGSDGNFYGTTTIGGANGPGTAFKMTSAGVISVLHSFAADHPSGSYIVNADGAFPSASLTPGSDGNFYSTCPNGGPNGVGTIFKVTPGGTFTLLYSFSAISGTTNADGAFPLAGLAPGTDGNFYGVTQAGGAGGFGTFFKITPTGTFTTLHSFNGVDGNQAVGIIRGSDGNFYVTTWNGGANSIHLGTVLQITPTGTVTVLHNFNGEPSDGAGPQGALIQGTDGNFYGTTLNGGANNAGTIFKITPSGTFTILHSLGGSDGTQPLDTLLQASDGNLYGTTSRGGAHSVGTLFKITPGGTFTLLYTFSAVDSSGHNTDGAVPVGGLVEGPDYMLYGGTSQGGANAYGTVYKLNVNLTPPPVITSLRPGSVNASGPAFSLLVKGTGFLNTSAVNWTAGTTTPLTTTYVSGTQLKAAVPASLTANPGRAKLTVTTPGTNPSNAKTFTIKLTTMKLVAATLTRDSSTGVITANITLKNIGYLTAPNLSLTKSTLGPQTSPVATTTTLPVSLGSVAAGASVSTSLTYPGSAGSSGTIAYLKVSGKFTGGAMGTALKVTLP